MFLNTWSIALSLINFLSLFLLVLAGRTAIRVLRGWDLSSDSCEQIQLENETWLASTLIQYALGFQVVSLIVYALAADSFSEVVVGAMCATGSLTSNGFGMPALFVKIGSVFVYGFWIVLHNIDISSEKYPLLKTKYIFLLTLLPLLLTDITLQTLYIYRLEPDIITSCCAVVFSEDANLGMNLIGAFSRDRLLPVFYGWTLSLCVVSWISYRQKSAALSWLLSFLWAVYLLLSFATITAILSSYIYAMPYHRCPFCILKPEYDYIGFGMYLTLILAVFFGVSQGIITVLHTAEVRSAVTSYQKFALRFSVVFLGCFTVISSYHYVLYQFFGGER